MNLMKSTLPHMSYADCLQQLRMLEANRSAAEARPLRVAILRSYTAEMLEPVLKLRLMLAGFSPVFFWGQYNQYVQEILDPGSPLYAFQPDLVLVLVRIDELMPDFVHEYGTKSAAQWEAIGKARVGQWGDLAALIQQRLHAQILVQNLALPDSNYFGVYDAQTGAGQTLVVHAINRALAEVFERHPGAYVWDFLRFIYRQGSDTVYDPKMWYLSKNPFRASIYPAMGHDLMRYVLSMLGKVRKCVVVDLDNTLWGGVAGEDGITGIALGHDYPGNCYRDLQRELLKLYHRGILLAINSKNNEADALQIIDRHPDMILRREHFAGMRINWADKASNLQALARELNIGVDSMVFLDDNPRECELVRQVCPECEVICLPDQVYQIPQVLKDVTGLENIRMTDEDRQKGTMYQSQAARRDFQESFETVEDFLRGLQLRVTIEEATDFSIPRIAQLTQKTNQLNLATRRYTEANIHNLSRNRSSAVFSVSARDRFGDSGIIGVIILRMQEHECHIDTFLLSCRVIGRNIEQPMFAFIFEFVRQRGISALFAEYIPTPKNTPSADLLPRFHFEQITATQFLANLSLVDVPFPSYIAVDTPLSEPNEIVETGSRDSAGS